MTPNEYQAVALRTTNADIVIKRKVNIGATREAWFSPCGSYRYLLHLQWSELPLLNFLMLNPSTADEMENDPTVERCERRAWNLGFGGVMITNLFALRSTDPNGLLSANDPIGPRNDTVLSIAGGLAKQIVCAWGTRPNPKFVASRMIKVIPNLQADKLRVLKLSKDGLPCHPLYLPYSLRPMPWAALEGK